MPSIIILSISFFIAFVIVGLLFVLNYAEFSPKGIKSVYRSTSKTMKVLIVVALIFPIAWLSAFRGSPANVPSLDEADNSAWYTMLETENGFVVAGRSGNRQHGYAHIVKYDDAGEKLWSHTVPDWRTRYDTLSLTEEGTILATGIEPVSPSPGAKYGSLPQLAFHVRSTFTLDGEELDYVFENNRTDNVRTHDDTRFTFDFDRSEAYEQSTHYDLTITHDKHGEPTSKTTVIANVLPNLESNDKSINLFYQDDDMFAFQIRLGITRSNIVVNRVYFMDYDQNIIHEKNLFGGPIQGRKIYRDMVRKDGNYYITLHREYNNRSAVHVYDEDFNFVKAPTFRIDSQIINMEIHHVTVDEETLRISGNQWLDDDREAFRGVIMEYDLDDYSHIRPSVTKTLREGVGIHRVLPRDDGYYIVGPIHIPTFAPVYEGRWMIPATFAHLNDREQTRILAFGD